MNAFTKGMVIYMNKFNGKIWKIGGSKVLTVPNKFAKANDLLVGSLVDVEVSKCIVNDTEQKPVVVTPDEIMNIIDVVVEGKEEGKDADEHRDSE